MLIRDLTQVATLDDNDLVVIYDHAAGRTRSATFGLVKSYIDPVVSGHYQGTDLVLILESGTTITIPGVAADQTIDINGNVVRHVKTNGGMVASFDAATKTTTLDTITTHSVGNYFVGIYNNLAALQAAIPSPPRPGHHRLSSALASPVQ